jgi:hypothetical protein
MVRWVALGLLCAAISSHGVEFDTIVDKDCLAGALSFRCESVLQQRFGQAPARFRSRRPGAPAPPGDESSTAESSSMTTGFKDTFPMEQVWTGCKKCAYENGRLLLFDPSGTLQQSHSSDSFRVSSTRWASFYAEPRSDQMHATIVHEAYSEARCDRTVAAPTFLFHLLTLHAGHFLVDVLEPLFQMHLAELGGVTLDSNVIFDVAGSPEQGVLHGKILEGAMRVDSIFKLFRLLTANTIHTKRAFDLLPGRTCFHQLHVGLDVSRAHFAHGYDAHPFALDATPGAAPSAVAGVRTPLLMRWYRQYQGFMEASLQLREVDGALALAAAANGGQADEERVVFLVRGTHSLAPDAVCTPPHPPPQQPPPHPPPPQPHPHHTPTPSHPTPLPCAPSITFFLSGDLQSHSFHHPLVKWHRARAPTDC